MTLTPKQRAFVDAYAGNATQAALAAGYSEKSARTLGPRILEHPAVVAAIQEREEQEKQARAEVIREEVAGKVADRIEIQAWLTSIIRNQELDTGVEGEPIPVSIRDRLKACELLGKSIALFTDKVEVGLDTSFADTLKLARERSARR